MPQKAAELRIDRLDVDSLPKVDVIFSALPSEVAARVEPEMARRGHMVVSNSSNMRLDPDVPLLIPEVNPDDLSLVKEQRARRGWSGFVIKKPNCSTTILDLPLKPILDEFGISRIHVATMQAVTGAGYAGVPSVAIIDNLIPYIKGEEEKIVNETRKIFRKRDRDLRDHDPRPRARRTYRGGLRGHCEGFRRGGRGRAHGEVQRRPPGARPPHGASPARDTDKGPG